MKKYFKIFIFIMIIFLNFNVFADTSYNMTSLITSPVNFPECGVGSYTGVELNGATNCWNTNTRYQGTLNRIYFNLPAPTGTVFDSDTSYRLTLNMSTQDWRNNFGTVVVSPGSTYTNNFVDTFTFVSMKQVNITFTVPYSGSTTYQYLYVNLPAKNSSSLITGVSNWNLSNVTLTKLTTGSAGGSSTPSGPTTTFDDTAIINSGKENTQDIINNNNTNTQDIINNNNANTQDIIDNQNQLLGSKCSNLIDIPDLSLNRDNNRTYDYILPNTLPSGTYTLSYNYSSSGNPSTYIQILLQNSSGTLSELTLNSTGKNTFTINSSFNRFYILISSSSDTGSSVNLSNLMLVSGGTAISYCKYGSFLSKIDETTNAINSSRDDIIDNQNENTNNQIESQKVCSTFDISDVVTNGYLSSNGQVNAVNSTAYGITDYIKISSDDSIIVTKSTGDTFYYCFYTLNKTIISCTRSNNDSVNSSISIPSNAIYVRFSIRRNLNAPQYSVCRNGNQVMNESINDINNSINNSNVDSNTGTGFFDNFTSEDFGLSQIITIPLTAIQRLTSSSCSSLNIPIPFTNSSVPLPCMTQIYEQNIPSVYNLWKIVSFGIIGYFICLDIFHIVKGFKDPESDKVEVLDL